MGTCQRMTAGRLATVVALVVGVVACSGATASALSVAPSVPSGVQTTGATLNGVVNPENVAVTDCRFEYGPTTTYGSTVPCSTGPGSGGAPITVSAAISGLTAGAFYHYRLSVTNAGGTERSADQRLITGPAIEGVAATGVTQFVATPSATIEPGEVPTTYRFAYGTSSEYGSVAPIPDASLAVARGEDSVSETVSGLAAGTTYHFALVASSAAGTFVGPDRTFTTLSIPAPSVSTGGASGIGVGAVTLAGAIDPQGWSTNYHFEYGLTSAYGSSWPTVDVNLGGLSGSQAVSVHVENLLPGAGYHYRLVATNGGGTTFGPDMTFSTASYPLSAIQATPVLTAPLGFFDPEAPVKKVKHKNKKIPGKHPKRKPSKKKGKKS